MNKFKKECKHQRISSYININIGTTVQHLFIMSVYIYILFIHVLNFTKN